MGAEGRRNGAKCLLCVEKETHREVAKHEEEREGESTVARFMTAARSRSARRKEGGKEGDTPKAKHDEVYLRNGRPQRSYSARQISSRILPNFNNINVAII